ncbi:MAG: hypothetical protein ACLQB4_05120 [Beijerinckiaceae bacterium]
MTIVDNSQSERQKIYKARYDTNLASAERIDKKYLEAEAYLSTTKWFDYRCMPPAKATDLFEHDYREAFKLKSRETYDYREAPFKEGLMRAPIRGKQPSAMDHANQAREYTSLWIARQQADILGLPYKFFIEHTMEACRRNGYTKIPRPNQLAAGSMKEKILMKVSEAWLANSFTFSPLPQYMNQAYDNHPAQNDHRDWVLDQLNIGRPLAVGRACFIHQVLPEDLAVKKYGEDRLSEARDEVAGEMPVAFTNVDRLDLVPSCFGLPHAFDKGRSICSACRQGPVCEKIVAKSFAELRKRHQTTEPGAAKVRKQNCERKRKQREKERARVAAIGAP